MHTTIRQPVRAARGPSTCRASRFTAPPDHAGDASPRTQRALTDATARRVVVTTGGPAFYGAPFDYRPSIDLHCLAMAPKWVIRRRVLVLRVLIPARTCPFGPLSITLVYTQTAWPVRQTTKGREAHNGPLSWPLDHAKLL